MSSFCCIISANASVVLAREIFVWEEFGELILLHFIVMLSLLTLYLFTLVGTVADIT